MATQTETKTRKPKAYSVDVVLKAGEHPGLILGLAARGSQVVAAGGQGHDLLLLSKDGKSFRTSDAGGRGLRAALIRESGEIFVAGEYGYVALSQNQGKSWEKVPREPRPWHKGEAPCLFGIVEDAEGTVWAAGDSGYLGRYNPENGRLQPLRTHDEYMGRIRTSPLGILMPTDPGHLFVLEGETARKLKLNAKAELMQAAVTPAGTLLVVGLKGALHRSTNQGKTFKRIEAPEVMLTNVDVLADGEVLVVGEGGLILSSTDDGQTFVPVKHREKKRTLWCCLRYGDGALIGGEDGLLLRYGP